MSLDARRRIPPPPGVSDNGHRLARSSLGATSRRHASWAVAGLLLVAGTILVFAAVASSTGQRVEVLVAARDLDPGRVVEAGDLRTASVNADLAASTQPATSAGLLIGRSPVGYLPAGTVVHGGLFTNGLAIPPGRTLVGARLKPGDLPPGDVRSGDRVALVAVPVDGTDDQPTVLALGELSSLGAPDGGDDGRTVSVSVELRDGPPVAAAAAADRLRVLVVPEETTVDDLRASVTPTGTPGGDDGGSGG